MSHTTHLCSATRAATIMACSLQSAHHTTCRHGKLAHNTRRSLHPKHLPCAMLALYFCNYHHPINISLSYNKNEVENSNHHSSRLVEPSHHRSRIHEESRQMSCFSFFWRGPLKPDASLLLGARVPSLETPFPSHSSPTVARGISGLVSGIEETSSSPDRTPWCCRHSPHHSQWPREEVPESSWNRQSSYDR